MKSTPLSQLQYYPVEYSETNWEVEFITYANLLLQTQLTYLYEPTEVHTGTVLCKPISERIPTSNSLLTLSTPSTSCRHTHPYLSISQFMQCWTDNTDRFDYHCSCMLMQYGPCHNHLRTHFGAQVYFVFPS